VKPDAKARAKAPDEREESSTGDIRSEDLVETDPAGTYEQHSDFEDQQPLKRKSLRKPVPKPDPPKPKAPPNPQQHCVKTV
jgi:hypothetical protein